MNVHFINQVESSNVYEPPSSRLVLDEICNKFLEFHAGDIMFNISHQIGNVGSGFFNVSSSDGVHNSTRIHWSWVCNITLILSQVLFFWKVILVVCYNPDIRILVLSPACSADESLWPNTLDVLLETNNISFTRNDTLWNCTQIFHCEESDIITYPGKVFHLRL